MAYTREQVLDILRRNTDADGWLAPLLADPDSAVVLNALADVGARMSLAIERESAVGMLTTAPGGAPGTAVVTVRCPNPLLGAQLDAGTSFVDSRGVRLTLRQNIALSAGLALPVVVETLRQTELVNTEDPADVRFYPALQVVDATNTTPITLTTTTQHSYLPGSRLRVSGVSGNTGANGVWILGGVTERTMVLLSSVGNGVYTGDGLAQPAPDGLVTESATNIEGALSDTLSVLGRERGTRRQEAESVGDYRQRVRNIADVVSPRALAQAIRGVGSPYDVRLLEPFEDFSSTALDTELGLGSYGSAYWGAGDLPPAASGSFAYDEFRSLMLDSHSACAHVLVEHPQVNDPDGLRMFFDDAFFDDPVWGFPDVLVHPALLARYWAIFDELETRRAACVTYSLTVVEETQLEVFGTVPAASGVGTYTTFDLQAPLGRCWFMRRAVQGLVTTLSGGEVTFGEWTCALRIDYADGTQVTTPIVYPNHDGGWVEPAYLLPRITRVRGEVYYSGGGPSTLAVRQVFAAAAILATI